MAQKTITAQELLEDMVRYDVIDRFAGIVKENQQLLRLDFTNGYQRHFSPRILKYVANPAGYIAENIYINCHDPVIGMQIQAEVEKIRDLVGDVDSEPVLVNTTKLHQALDRIATLEKRDKDGRN